MLPILPIHTKKKKKTTHRPRPQPKRRCVAKPGASQTAAAKSTVNAPVEATKVQAAAAAEVAEADVTNVQAPTETASVDASAAAFSEAAALPHAPAGFADAPPLPQVNLDTNDANDQALVLAAEAAAALLEDVDVGESIDAAALLGVDVPTAPNDIEATEHVHETAELGELTAENSIQENEEQALLPPVPALPPLGHLNPLGSNVKTFNSEPPKAAMSCVHSNFLQYYYNNEAVGIQHALDVNIKKKKSDVANDRGDSSDIEDNEKGEGEDGEKIAERKALMSYCSKYPKRKEEKVKEEHNNDGVDENEPQKSVTVEKESTAETSALDSSTNNNNEETTQEQTPQVDFVDGELVVRNSTLFPSANRVSTSAIDDEFGTAIEEDESTALGIVQARYDSYTTKTRTKPSRWSVDETRAFYRALRQCGSDFSMMQMFLPGRSRSQLKSKFKLEQRRHPRLVDLALDPRKVVKLDLSVFGELEIPEEVTPISTVQPGVTPEPGAADVLITETPAVKKDENAVQAEPDIDRMFDHLFDDTNTNEQMTDQAATQADDATVDRESQEIVEKPEDKHPALLLAPVVKPKVKKTKKFKAKPMAKKAATKK
jgi:hypothetical protein